MSSFWISSWEIARLSRRLPSRRSRNSCINRPLFLYLAAYVGAAFVAVLLAPQGAGESETGPGSREPLARTAAA
jgi:hypothetical protein